MKFTEIIQNSGAMDTEIEKNNLNIAINYKSTSIETGDVEVLVHGNSNMFDKLDIIANLVKALDVPFDLLLEAISFLNEGDDEHE